MTQIETLEKEIITAMQNKDFYLAYSLDQEQKELIKETQNEESEWNCSRSQ